MWEHKYRALGMGMAVWASAVLAVTEPAGNPTLPAPLQTAIACDFEHGGSTVDHSVILGGRRYKARLAKTVEHAQFTPHGTAVSGNWEGDVLRVTAISEEAPSVAAVPHRGRTLLVIFVSFSDLPYGAADRKAFESLLPQLTAFFDKSSHGALSLACTVLPDAVLIQAGSSDAYDYWRVVSEVMTKALATNPTYAGFDHFMLALPYVRNLPWLGLGEVTGRYTWINGNGGWGVLAHELGHNLGLNHAHGWRPTTADPLGPGVDLEYGDVHDLMGNPYQASDFSNVYKAQLGWIPPEGVIQVTGPGVVRLNRPGLQSAGVVDLATVGYDPGRCLALQSAPGQPDAVEVRWAMRSGLGQRLESITYLLDMTPLSGGDLSDALLIPGAELVDSPGQTRISVPQPASAGPLDWANLLVDCPVLAPQLQIVWPPSGQELILNEPITVTSSALFQVENIAEAELMANGRVVAVSLSPPFDLAWTPTSLAVSNLSILTRDIYQQTVVSTPTAVRITWRAETNSWTLPGTSLAHLTWAVDAWLAVANGRLCSSADLLSWQPVDMPAGVGGTVQAIARGPGGVVAVGSEGLVAFSLDGHSWFGQSLGASSWNVVTAFGTMWVVAGEDGQAAVSADGQSWRVVTVLPGANLIGLAASDRGCIGVAATGRVVELSGLTNVVNDTGYLAKRRTARISAVGIPGGKWPNQSLGKDVTCEGITWDGNLFWIVGSSASERRLYNSGDGQVWSAMKAAAAYDAWLSVLAAVPGGPLVGAGKYIDYRLSNGAWRKLMPAAMQFQEIVPLPKQLILLGRSDAGTMLATISLPETLYDQWAANLQPDSRPELLGYALGSPALDGARLRISMVGPEQARIGFDAAVLRPDVRYIIEESTDLSTWAYALDLPGMYPAPGPTKFFRLRLERIPLY